MSNKTDIDIKLSANDKINPNAFDITVSAMLISLGAEKYVEIFRKHNIGQYTLLELTEEDLIKLGIDDKIIRKKLIEEVKNLPIYQELPISTSNLGPIEVVEILEESSQHLYRIYLSMLANTLAVKKTKKIPDCLVHNDKYASDIALLTLNEIVSVLNSMDITLHTQLKTFTEESKSAKNKKIIVGTIGSVVIAALSVMFVRSLKQINVL